MPLERLGEIAPQRPVRKRRDHFGIERRSPQREALFPTSIRHIPRQIARDGDFERPQQLAPGGLELCFAIS